MQATHTFPALTMVMTVYVTSFLSTALTLHVTIQFLHETVIVYTCDSLVVHQFYQSRVIDEFVLRGNTATVKCLIPSFVADFVEVVEWVTDDGSFASSPTSDTNYGNKKCCHLFLTLLVLNVPFICRIYPSLLFQVARY